jgi:hypothetical protein
MNQDIRKAVSDRCIQVIDSILILDMPIVVSCCRYSIVYSMNNSYYHYTVHRVYMICTIINITEDEWIVFSNIISSILYS